MQQPHGQLRDPVGWTWIIAGAFLTLVLMRLNVPGHAFFDEVHYVPAARAWLNGQLLNLEHPPLGKLILAGSMRILGDNVWGWRLPGALAGAVTLFAAMRALWFASCRRFATLAYGVLLATGFMLFVQSRVAMLDMPMAMFLGIALWQAAAACREPETGRWRLALCGVMLGLALGTKWNVAPLLPLPGAAFFIWRLRAGRRRLLTSRRGLPVPGVSLLEAGLWLGVVPLLVYAATFAPAFWLASDPLQGDFLSHQRRMLALQESVVTPHNYQSAWWQWAVNLRPIWYMYEFTDGAQRGILMLGNPLTMLLGLAALGWCGWAAALRADRTALAIAVLYAVGFGFWIVAAKPVQFFYHYLLPHCFLLAALALALDALWRRGRRWAALLPLGTSVALFAWFWPILSAGPLAERDGFQRWMWLASWI